MPNYSRTITFKKLLLILIVIVILVFILSPLLVNNTNSEIDISPEYIINTKDDRTPLNQLSLKYSKLFENGRQKFELIGKFHSELIIKYWELKLWLETLFKINNSASASAALLTKKPEFFDFYNTSYNLWAAEENDDRIIGQLVWKMQLIIDNYFKIQQNNKQTTRQDLRPKIFVGDMKYLHPHFLPNTKNPKIISGCEINNYGPSIESMEPKCELVTNEIGKPINWSTIDAIATFSGPIGWGWIGSIEMEKNHELPLGIPWFVFITEPPHRVHVKAKNQYRKQLITWMTDSAISFKDNKWIPYNPFVRSQAQGVDYIAGKTKMAAIVVSNCDEVYNDRLLLVKQLQKYIQVDIYGKCGEQRFKDICPINQSDTSCLKKIGMEYKFYLSFENSNCRHYITEKLQRNAFSNNMIPIVMGAHPEDYKSLIPENSYIHVDDFKSPKQLAEFMEYVATHKQVYNSYFRWKGTGEFHGFGEKFFCRLCPMLYYYDKYAIKPQKYDWALDSKLDTNGNEMCLPKGQWYWTR